MTSDNVILARVSEAGLADRRLSRRALAVLVALASHDQRRSGFVWPSQTRLARMTGYHRQQINTAIAELREHGYLIDHGRRHRALYLQLIAPPLPQEVSATADKTGGEAAGAEHVLSATADKNLSATADTKRPGKIDKRTRPDGRDTVSSVSERTRPNGRGSGSLCAPDGAPGSASERGSPNSQATRQAPGAAAQARTAINGTVRATKQPGALQQGPFQRAIETLRGAEGTDAANSFIATAMEKGEAAALEAAGFDQYGNRKGGARDDTRCP